MPIGKILLCHPTGNANVRQALRALNEAGLLDAFVTTVAAYPGNWWHRLSKTGPGREFVRRAFDDSLRGKTIQHPLREIGRLLAPRLGLGFLTAHETGFLSVDSVYSSLDRTGAKRIRSLARSGNKEKSGIAAAYAYEDGALDTFKTAKSVGMRCLYDLPIGYWRAARRIQAEEAERLPDWAATMPALIDSDAKVARKDKELALADHIIVASRFTADTLREAPFPIPDPAIIPYGCPQVSEGLDPRTSRSGSKVRVLFVGGLSQRKGLSYLFEAVDQLSKACELTIIGRRPPASCKPLQEALSRHTWIESLPHHLILEQMRAHDVLVFPSLFEGFGLVVTEALSQGIPVITTPHTCGPDILTDGEDGFIVPIRDSDAIAEKLEMLHSDRDRLDAMKVAARNKASVLTWQKYRLKLIETIKPLLEI